MSAPADTAPAPAVLTLEEFQARVGEELGVSHWLTVDQAMIDAFADVTGDHQYIHTDPARAAVTPFGTTIAHGFLSLSLLTTLAQGAVPGLPSVVMGINYGFDRIRFISPLPSGARLRARFTLAQAGQLATGEVSLVWDVLMEAEGQSRPVLAARWLVRRHIEEGAAAPGKD